MISNFSHTSDIEFLTNSDIEGFNIVKSRERGCSGLYALLELMPTWGTAYGCVSNEGEEVKYSY